MNEKKHSRLQILRQDDEPHLLREIMRLHQVLMSGFSRQVGMPASRFALLRLLAIASPEYAGIMDLARKLGINAAAVTRQVKEMEREGIILRRSDAQDGRRSYVTLSAKGFRLFKDIQERCYELELALSSLIGSEEMATTATVLTKIREFIEKLR